MNARTITSLVLSALLLLPASAASAQVGEIVDSTTQPTDIAAEAEYAFVEHINVSRSTQGLGALSRNASLQEVAKGWTAQLVVTGTLSHNPSYAAQYDGDWRRMGENVGYTSRIDDVGASVARVHQAFIDSPGHRANIMGDYNQVGVGVGVDPSGTMWVTVNFLDGPVPAPPVEAVPDIPEVQSVVTTDSVATTDIETPAPEEVPVDETEQASAATDDEPFRLARDIGHFTRGRTLPPAD